MSLQLESILYHINPFHIFTTYFFKIHFKIIHLSTSRKVSLPFMFYIYFNLFRACYIPD